MVRYPAWPDNSKIINPESQTLRWQQTSALRSSASSGTEADEHGNARALDAAQWQERKHRLQKLGGSPLLD